MGVIDDHLHAVSEESPYGRPRSERYGVYLLLAGSAAFATLH